MLRLRRTSHEPRVEIVPLIDVIFLLLTFFVYAMVLMVRIDLLPMDLQRFESAQRATPQPAIVIHIDLAGRLLVNDEIVQMDNVLGKIQAAQSAQPGAVIYLALAAGVGTIDRAPILTELWDHMKNAGLKINFVGRPKDAP